MRHRGEAPPETPPPALAIPGVAIETWPDAAFGRRDFQRELWYAAQNLFGDAGSADLDMTVLRFDLTDGEGAAVVRTRRARSPGRERHWPASQRSTETQWESA